LAKKAGLPELLKLMRKLRRGCPWDKKQTPETLKTYIIEEAYELVDAIESGVPEKVCDELGDLLFQIIFQAQIFSERGLFDLAEVIDRTHKKMVARHPHVFAGGKLSTAEQVKKQWVSLKKQTRPKTSVLGETPKSLPGLLRARRITDNAAQVGFDWEKTEQVMAKVKEELRELEKAVRSRSRKQKEHELGDLLFALVNLSRFLRLNPEDSLRKAIARFEDRFHFLETEAEKQGRELREMTLQEMDLLWEKAKRLGK
jgi:MazG family protein